MKIFYNLTRTLIFGMTLTLVFSICHAATNKGFAPRQQIMPLDEGQIAYYRFGHGSTIVLITGYGATLSEWNNTFLKTLARTHDVIVFDNRGVGNSRSSSQSYTMEDLTDDTSKLIMGLHLHLPTILGWSMGGMIAQSLAIIHPQLVGKLILMDTTIGGNTAIAASAKVKKKLTDTSGTDKEKFNRIISILFPADDAPAMSKTFVAEMFKPTGKPEDPASLEVIKQQEMILTTWATANNVPQQLQQIHIPTMVLTGTKDAITPPKNARVLAEMIPGAELVEIQNGGHAMMYQYPVQIANLISSFISSKR